METLQDTCLPEEPLANNEEPLAILDRLSCQHPYTFLRLVQKCRDETEELPDDILEVLAVAGIVTEDGSIIEIVQTAVLSCVEGHGREMRLRRAS